jgi:ABC-type multidrug transport system fused ATPase/permease subunit
MNFKKIYFFLKIEEKKKIKFIIFLFLLGALMECLSVGLVLPIFSIISTPKELLLSNDLFGNNMPNLIITLIINTEQKTIIYITLLVLILTYLLKNIYLSISSYFVYKNIYQIQINISNNLFLKYLRENYSFFLNNNKSILVRNINDEVGTFVRRLLVPLALMISEILTIILISAILVIINFYASLISLTIGFIFGFLLIFFTKKRIKKWSIDRQIYSGKKYKSIYETFNSIIDIKLKEVELFFFNIFKNYNTLNIKADRNVDTLNLMPRYALEFIGVFLFCTIFFILFQFSYKVESILPILALYLAAAFRLLPSVNRVLVYYNSFLYGYRAFEKIDEEFNFNYTNFNLNDSIAYSDKSKQIFKIFESIELKDITFKYNLKDQSIFENINLKIKINEFIGIYGPSGIGKSTLLLLLTGLLKPNSGKLILNNNSSLNLSDFKSNLFGYVPQRTTLIDDTIKRNIAFGQQEKDIDNFMLDYVVDICQLKSFIENSANNINSIIGDDGLKVSGGQRQRLALARALYFSPMILILDEATNQLDESTENKILNIVNSLRGKITLIFISHKISNLNICDKIYEVNKSKINLL